MENVMKGLEEDEILCELSGEGFFEVGGGWMFSCVYWNGGHGGKEGKKIVNDSGGQRPRARWGKRSLWKKKPLVVVVEILGKP